MLAGLTSLGGAGGLSSSVGGNDRTISGGTAAINFGSYGQQGAGVQWAPYLLAAVALYVLLKGLK